jgi:hypothetical protein
MSRGRILHVITLSEQSPLKCKIEAVALQQVPPSYLTKNVRKPRPLDGDEWRFLWGVHASQTSRQGINHFRGRHCMMEPQYIELVI